MKVWRCIENTILYLKCNICRENIFLNRNVATNKQLSCHNKDGRLIRVSESEVWPRPWSWCACALQNANFYFEIRDRKCDRLLNSCLRHWIVELEETTDNSSSSRTLTNWLFGLFHCMWMHAVKPVILNAYLW